MKLMFICSSLEMGRDGVGDYVRLLAEECRALGIECCSIALHDSHVAEPVEMLDTGRMPALRLPASMPWSKRVERAVAFRLKARPDWISLQFVPYGFNAKGVVWSLERHLQRIVENAKLHVMFHELWIGVNRTASWKDRIVGAFQRVSIVRLIRRLAPALIATSNGTYVKMLGTQQVNAQLLALFGNIPVAVRNDIPPSLPDIVSTRNPSLHAEGRDSLWLAVFFGTLHPEWEPEPLFSIIQRAVAITGRQVCFVAVGRLGVAGDRKWASMAEHYAEDFSFVTVGEQKPEKVSDLFQAADFGIAASPWQLIGKSGSAIAMLEHGLPVIANRDNWQARGIDGQGEANPLLHRCDERLEKKLIAGLPKRKPKSGMRATAEQFVRSLRQNAAGLLPLP